MAIILIQKTQGLKMFVKFVKFFLLLSIIFVFDACVGQPKVQKSQAQQSNVLWDENTNPYKDEDDNVDVSDLDKEVSTSDEAQQQTGQTVQRIPFPVAEYSRLARNGKGTVEGYIYLQDVYGTKIYGKKTRLYLNPVTSYSKQWYEESYINGKKLGKADSRLFNYLRFTASDESGKFAFYGVPSGRYYLIGTVTCGSECGYTTPKNIRIATEVYIEGNQIVNHDLRREI